MVMFNASEEVSWHYALILFNTVLVQHYTSTAVIRDGMRCVALCISHVVVVWCSQGLVQY